MSDPVAGPRPTVWPRTGGCLECEIYLDATLKDPSSFEKGGAGAVTEPALVEAKGGRAWRVEMTYRAKNSFGALVRERKAFLIRGGRLVGVED